MWKNSFDLSKLVLQSNYKYNIYSNAGETINVGLFIKM